MMRGHLETFTFFLAGILAGCASAPPAARTPAPPREKRIAVEVTMPVLERQGRSADLMREGVTMRLDPSVGDPERWIRVDDGVPKEDGDALSFLRTTTPYYVPPERTAFDLRISNSLPVRLDLTGAVVTVSAGKTPVPAEHYSDSVAKLKSAVIRPGTVHSTRFLGPKYDSLGGAETVTVAIEEVPTAFDSDDVVARRSSFKWRFMHSSRVYDEDDVLIIQCFEKSPTLRCPGGPRGGYCKCADPRGWRSRGAQAPMAKVFVVRDARGPADRLAVREKLRIGASIVLEARPRDDLEVSLRPTWTVSPKGIIRVGSGPEGRITVTGAARGKALLSIREPRLGDWSRRIEIRVK